MIAKAQRYWALPRLERVGLPVVFLLLGISFIAIHTVRFKRLVSWLGKAHGVSPAVPLIDRPQWHRARRIGWAVRTTARYTPWPSKCFAQALTSALIMKYFQIPFGVYFGLAKAVGKEGATEDGTDNSKDVDKDGGKEGATDDAKKNGASNENIHGLQAHAWVASGACSIVGDDSFGRYVVVGCWIWQPNI
ncbi:MAG: lasso peptide biosynthesis B2 protein [Balneolaceae bacterium]|nr:lasso peptide biosynthesis B2 protein [Balneolaceae bacterium]